VANTVTQRVCGDSDFHASHTLPASLALDL